MLPQTARRLLHLIFAFLFALSGVAFAAPPRRVAVASLFDNTLHKIHVGVTVFSNTYESKDVADWRVPETSEADLVTLIKQKGIGEEVAVLPQPGARARWDNRGVEQQLISAAREAGFDVLVLISPTSYDNAPFLKPGYGVFASGGMFGPPPACPYGLFMVEVYRTADADRIDWRWGFSSWGDGPCVGLRSVPWKDTLAEYTDEDWTKVKEAIHKRIVDGMTRALDGLDFE